jgi:hypothetical protein
MSSGHFVPEYELDTNTEVQSVEPHIFFFVCILYACDVTRRMSSGFIHVMKREFLACGP